MPSKRTVILTRPPRPPSARDYGSDGNASKTEDAPVVKRPPSPPLIGGGGEGGPTYGPPGSDEKKKKPTVLAELKAASSQLTKSERKELLDHLASLQLSDGDSTRDIDMWATAAWDALTAAIGTGGAGMPGPMVLKSLLAARSSWAPVEAFAKTVGLLELTVAERRSGYMLLARLLVDRARSVARHVGAPLSAKMVANNTGDIAAIFNSAFPGYAGSGLGRIVFKRLAQQGLREEADGASES